VHRATTRDHFARGAVTAARWVLGQPPGLYSMEHVLQLD
jgi:4-hydroxy-tetrahydrodipicolinate reductase